MDTQTLLSIIVLVLLVGFAWIAFNAGRLLRAKAFNVALHTQIELARAARDGFL